MENTEPKRHETAKVAMEKYRRDGAYFAPWVLAQGNQNYPYNPEAKKIK